MRGVGQQGGVVSFKNKREEKRQWVYRTKAHVMVFVDTRTDGTDGNKFLMVFDVAHECVDPAMRNAWSKHWGSGLLEKEA
jgi:hypothetical protein